MKRKLIRPSKNGMGFFLLLFLLPCLLFMSIGYAVLNSELSISGEAHVRVSDLIRITDLEAISKVNGAYETYNSKYSKNTTSMFVTLPNTNSEVIYQITISNVSTEKYQLRRIVEESNTNPNVKYEIIGFHAGDIVEENSSVTFQVKFTTSSSNQKEELVLRYEFEKYVESPIKEYNDNIIIGYTYDASTCITGEEATCVETTCYKDKSVGSCPSGTIIKYNVNGTNVIPFHVMFDEGETLTMQSQRNILYSVKYSSSGNSQGPIVVLPALEEATAGWKNVNSQTYTMGTTVFKTNAFTGCGSYKSCTTNKYTLPERTAKARMITLQEAALFGCTGGTGSCPKWMYNYLTKSTDYGGTVNDNTNNNRYYWTMTASSSNTSNAFVIIENGYLIARSYSTSAVAARAVVVVNK